MYQEKVVTLQCKSDFLCRKLLIKNITQMSG